MKITRTALFAVTALLPTFGLAGCQDKKASDDGAVTNAAIEDVPEPEPAPAPAPDGNAADDATNDIGNAAAVERLREDEKGPIPLAFRGRWGLIPKDCGTDRAIAKGLMTVTGDMLRFYESVGKPVTVNAPTPASLNGNFAFTGEGMEWTKKITMKLDGDTLTRTEDDPNASYTYKRCRG